MKKIFRVSELDCANCAAKMERAILKIDGVRSASVNFMGQKICLEMDEERLEEIINNMVAVCKKVEPDCVIKI